MLALAMFALALGTLHFLSPRWSPINYALTGEALPAVPRPQRPPTLEPGQFTGRAAEAYRVARERPALLERLPCYCGCFTQQGHQNLLDCFAGAHAAHCETCQSIALRAAALALRRYAPEDIKAVVDREFAPPR